MNTDQKYFKVTIKGPSGAIFRAREIIWDKEWPVVTARLNRYGDKALHVKVRANDEFAAKLMVKNALGLTLTRTLSVSEGEEIQE